MELPALTQTPDERTALAGMLDYYRAVLYRKLDGVSQAGALRTVGASNLTLMGLVKHMAIVEDSWFTDVFGGQPMPEPWAAVDWSTDPDWEWHSAADDSVPDVLAMYDAACERSRNVAAAADSLDAIASEETRQGQVNLRWIFVHMIEETARHAGHADLLREAVDGATGD